MSEHHACFCGPCSIRIVELEHELADADHWAELAGKMQTERDNAMQIIINLQDYLRANGRSFPAAVELIREWRAETGLGPIEKAKGAAE